MRESLSRDRALKAAVDDGSAEWLSFEPPPMQHKFFYAGVPGGSVGPCRRSAQPTWQPHNDSVPRAALFQQTVPRAAAYASVGCALETCRAIRALRCRSAVALLSFHVIALHVALRAAGVGGSIHVDFHRTGFWNALIHGKKR